MEFTVLKTLEAGKKLEKLQRDFINGKNRNKEQIHEEADKILLELVLEPVRKRYNELNNLLKGDTN